MTRSKNTKRALLASVLSLMLCVAMLVGSTFAWFTDTVTSEGNIIKSGKLDVTMEWAEGTESPDAAEWQDASERAIFDYDKWEPGYTEVRHIKISNVGTLALKYDVSIRAEDEIGKLAEVIDVYYIKGGKQIADRTALNDDNRIGTLADLLKEDSVANGHISGKKGEIVSSDIATIAFKMQESAGNEYQDASIGGNFSIILNATQYTEEEDSFGNDYDKDAKYPVSVSVSNDEDLKEALNTPGVPVEITLTERLSDTSNLTVTGDVTLNLGDNALNKHNMDSVGAYITVNNGGSLIINANIREGFLKYTAGKLTTDGADSSLTVNGGAYGDSGYRNANVTARNGSVIHLNTGSFSASGAEGHTVMAESGSMVYINGGSYSTSGAGSSTIYANGGIIIISAYDSIRANGKNFDAANGGKIIISKASCASKPTSIGTNCFVADDGENWVITQK